MPPPNFRDVISRRLVLSALSFGVVLGLALGSFGLMPVPTVDVEWTIPVASARDYAPSATNEAGEELLLIYVGSSTCGWSNRPELQQMVRGLKIELRSRALMEGRSFAAIGIARDRRASDGLSHLDKFGLFDEVAAGHGWANSGLQKYIYGSGEMAGRAVTPQIILVSRRLHYPAGHVSIADEHVLLRRTGLDQISEWVDDGAPIPDHDDERASAPSPAFQLPADAGQ